jgi:hypothetical protein
VEIKEFLGKAGVHIEIRKHTPVFTAQRMAAMEEKLQRRLRISGSPHPQAL